MYLDFSSAIMRYGKEQAVMKTLLQGRDPATYNMLYGYRRVRDVYDPPTRGASGKNVVLPFYDR